MYLPVLHYLQFQYCLVLWYYYACDASNQQQSPLAVDSSAASSGLGLLAEDWRRAVGLVLLPVLPVARCRDVRYANVFRWHTSDGRNPPLTGCSAIVDVAFASFQTLAAPGQLVPAAVTAICASAARLGRLERSACLGFGLRMPRVMVDRAVSSFCLGFCL